MDASGRMADTKTSAVLGRSLASRKYQLALRGGARTLQPVNSMYICHGNLDVCGILGEVRWNFDRNLDCLASVVPGSDSTPLLVIHKILSTFFASRTV